VIQFSLAWPSLLEVSFFAPCCIAGSPQLPSVVGSFSPEESETRILPQRLAYCTYSGFSCIDSSGLRSPSTLILAIGLPAPFTEAPSEACVLVCPDYARSLSPLRLQLSLVASNACSREITGMVSPPSEAPSKNRSVFVFRSPQSFFSRSPTSEYKPFFLPELRDYPRLSLLPIPNSPRGIHSAGCFW